MGEIFQHTASAAVGLNPPFIPHCSWWETRVRLLPPAEGSPWDNEGAASLPLFDLLSLRLI